jgi:ABC-type transport system involved in cytochrome bd biosynthesis fused ATPase/permease subunit
MNEGRIVEIGSHQELIKAGGFYAELERIQREGADESDYEQFGVPTGTAT